MTKSLTSIRHSLEVETDEAPLCSLRLLLSNLSSSLLQLRRNSAPHTMQSSRKGSNTVTMDRLRKNTFSHPVKVTMPLVARMGERLKLLVDMIRLVQDRDE